MSVQESTGPDRMRRGTLPCRPEVSAMALAGYFSADMFLEHLLDRIEETRT